MREVTITLYHISELGEEAKARAIEHYRNTNCDYAWLRESLASVNAFCDHFGVKLNAQSVASVNAFCDHFGVKLDVQSVCAHAPARYATSATSADFRGVKYDPALDSYTPTGYPLDCDLWRTYTAVFKATGSAFRAFHAGLTAGFKAWQADLAHQESDEYITEELAAQGREFYEDGKEYTC